MIKLKDGIVRYENIHEVDLERIVIMCGDIEVAKWTGISWDFINIELVPKALITKWDQPVISLENIKQITELSLKLNRNFLAWCSSRVISVNRKYFKEIINALHLGQGQSMEERATIALSFRCVSLLDSYWVRFGNEDTTTWMNVNLRKNSLSKSMILVALTGSSLSIQDNNVKYTAEHSTLGTYPKAWIRENDGAIWLYKTSDSEEHIHNEVCASMIIDCFNIYGNVKYTEVEYKEIKCTKCKLMSTEDKSILHAIDINTWCIEYYGMSYLDYAKELFPHQFGQMVIIDYLLANSDRHQQNWGYYQDTKTGNILGLYDLYDHNQCFHYSYLKNENMTSLLEINMSMKEAALYWKAKCDLHLISNPDISMFPSKEAYNIFNKRCDQLNIGYYA